MILTLRRLQC